jgi:hypothetical protein
MPYCPNPRCGRRNRNTSLTVNGLHMHLSASAECESFFLERLARETSSSFGTTGVEHGVRSAPSGSDTFSAIPPVLELDRNEPRNHLNDLSMNHDVEEGAFFETDDSGEPPPPEAGNEDVPTLHCTVSLTTGKPKDTYSFAADNSYSSRDWVKQWIMWTESRNNVAEVDGQHPTKKPDELGLLYSLLNDPNYLPGWNCVSHVEKAEIHLMHRLNKIKGCPLYVYDAVLDWAKEWLCDPENHTYQKQDTVHMMKSREQLLKSSVIFAHTKAMKPDTQNILLDRCRRHVKITSMSYLANLYNMLTSPDLVNDTTLLLNGPTPYHNPRDIDAVSRTTYMHELDNTGPIRLGTSQPADDLLPEPKESPTDYVIDDFNTGTRYITAWHYMKKSTIDFPLGEILFVDKSCFDMNDRLTSEPVVHTNSLVNCETRNKAKALQNLGIIPSNKTMGHVKAIDRLHDYHQCLSVIMGDYLKLQKHCAGILWPLCFKGTLYMVRFRPYMLTCLGDTPGQNVMAGKQTKCNRLCRYCDIEKPDLSKPWTAYNLMTVERQRKIQSSSVLRQKFNYNKIDVFWNQIEFGNDVHGIHGNVPGEILHAFQKGLYVRVAECLSQVPALSAAARKAEIRTLRENDLGTSSVGVGAVAKKGGKKKVVPKKKEEKKKHQRALPKKRSHPNVTTRSVHPRQARNKHSEKITGRRNDIIQESKGKKTTRSSGAKKPPAITNPPNPTTVDTSALKKIPSKKRKANKSKTAQELELADLIRNGVFGGDYARKVDLISVKIGTQLSRQSDRNICRVNFPKGIMNRAKTTASEQQGLTFLMNIILCSSWALQTEYWSVRKKTISIRPGPSKTQHVLIYKYGLSPFCKLALNKKSRS